MDDILNVLELKETRKPIDFYLLRQLSRDGGYISFDDLIVDLTMDLIPLSHPVQKLGYYLGVLTEPEISDSEFEYQKQKEES